LKDTPSQSSTATEQKFWTSIKVFLFCDAEQPMTLSQLACVWLFVAVTSWVLLMGTSIMISNL
jgi:hypothetical protein